MKKFVTFFGVGLSPKAPGTMGTLAAIPLAWALSWTHPLFYMLITFLGVAAAIWACDRYEKKLGGHDRSEIVIDEVLGFMVTMTWLPRTWQAYLYGFLLFRALDIFKPFPIGYVDKKGRGGLSVVADDVIAGIIANVILQYVYTHTHYLGRQWTE